MRAIVNFIKKYARTIVAIAVAFVPGLNVYAAGFLSGLIASGGDIKQGIVGALTAGAFNQVGSYFKYVEGGNAVTGLANGLTKGQQALKTLAHGAVGGVSSIASGGKFGEGFISAGATQAFSGKIDGLDSGNGGFSAQRAIAASVVGGTASVATGGKFANGAVTAAFSRAFNDEAHYTQSTSWSLGDPLPQGLVDFVAGWGDTLSFGLTAGARNLFGIGSVNYGSSSYLGGIGFGAVNGLGLGWAAGLNGGARSVFWSGAGNLERAMTVGISLERTVIGGFLNSHAARVPDIVWKVASGTFALNATGTATKVGYFQGRIWKSIEQPILKSRGVPINTIP